MPLLSRSTGTVSLFDIRLDNAKKNVIVIRGSPGTAASVLLSGKVVLALSEPISIKRISLKLSGKVRLQWTDNSTIAKTGAPRHYRYESTLFVKEWPNLELGSSINPDTASTTNSTSNLTVLATQNNTSSTNSTVSRSSSSSQISSSTSVSHILPQGNHEFPFETVIPGSIDESIEGMHGGFVAYKLVATVERGRFTNNLTSKKHLRVIRTLGSELLDLSQSVSIDKTWPRKIDYTLSIPNKAIALGSMITVDIKMTPLLKGLKLGDIRVWLAEIITLSSPIGISYSYERCVVDRAIPSSSNTTLNDDVWVVKQSFALPADLSKCTQDCTVHSYIKVGHKLKFSIILKNPDGHTSELQASLPVCVFISPNVPINTASASENVVLFSSGNPASAESQCIHSGELLHMAAPPNYDDHIYDRLWNDIAIANFDSPIDSGANTPSVQRFHINSIDQHGASSAHGLSNTGTANNSSANLSHLSNPQAHSHLVRNLHELQRQQISNEGNASSASRQGNHNSDEGATGINFMANPSHSSERHESESSDSNHVALPAFPSPVATVRRSGVSSPPLQTLGIHSSSLHSDSLVGTSPSGLSGLDIASTMNRSRVPPPAAIHSPHSDFIGSHSPEYSHLSQPHHNRYQTHFLSSSPNNNSHTINETDNEMEVLSRVPSYETAIHSESSFGSDEAPRYDNISNVVNRAFAGTSPSQNGSAFSTRSVTNLNSFGNTNHANPSSDSRSPSFSGTSSSSLRRAAASATQLSTHFLGSLTIGHHPSSSGPSSSSVALAATFGGPAPIQVLPANSSNSVSRSKLSHNVSSSNGRAISHSDSVQSRSTGSVSGSYSRARSQSTGSTFSNVTRDLPIATRPPLQKSSRTASGSSTPQGDSATPSISEASSSSLLGTGSSSQGSLTNVQAVLNNFSASERITEGVSTSISKGTPDSIPESDDPASKPVYRSKPPSGTSTPTQRSYGSKSLIGEATKLLHLTKLSQKQI